MLVNKENTQQSFPVFDEDFGQGDDLVVAALLPDTVDRHADSRLLHPTHLFVYYGSPEQSCDVQRFTLFFSFC